MKISNKTVCIIGAGPSGLTVLKNILASNTEDGSTIVATVFEQSSNIGGVWNYNEELAQTVFNNPMYQGLRTNLPKQLMQYLDFSHENYEVKETHVSRQDVFNYLTKYADAHDLKNHIQFGRCVTNVKPTFQLGNMNPKWVVQVQDGITNLKSWNYEFDSVIVCSGSQSKPKYSDNYELICNSFRGETLHSINYNKADTFEGKSVLLIGGGPSGRDIGVEILQSASQVYISLNDFDKQKFRVPDNIKNFTQIRRIVHANERSVITSDNVEIYCDVIMFCTGYVYSYPFLEDSILKITDGGKHVTPLYLHMIHRNYPTLCIIGIGELHLPFLLSDCQARFYTKYLKDAFVLPTELQMTEEYNNDQIYRRTFGWDGTKSHFFYYLQWLYMKKLAAACGFSEELQNVVETAEKILFTVARELLTNPFGFRERDFEQICKDAQKCVKDPIGINADVEKDPLNFTEAFNNGQGTL